MGASRPCRACRGATVSSGVVQGIPCAGTYYNGMEGWLRWVGIRRLYSAQYVGGLNAGGAPHGIGVWMDSYRHGEFLVGCEPCHVPRVD